MHHSKKSLKEEFKLEYDKFKIFSRGADSAFKTAGKKKKKYNCKNKQRKIKMNGKTNLQSLQLPRAVKVFLPKK